MWRGKGMDGRGLGSFFLEIVHQCRALAVYRVRVQMLSYALNLKENFFQKRV